jgi:hypothetical protein
MGLSSKAIIGIGVSFFLLAILFPIAMDQVMAANMTGWNAAVKTIFSVVLPILVVIGTAIAYVRGTSD